MRTVEDVEQYLQDSTLRFQDLGGGLYVVDDLAAGLHRLAIKVDPPLVVFRLPVGSAPAPGAAREAAFEKLLRLNGAGLLHSAFSLQDDGVCLTAALPLDNLDVNEFQAVLDDIGLAVSQHIPGLGLGLAS